MVKQYLSIIGSSSIINQHIVSAKRNGFEIINICTTSKRSKNINKIASTHKIKNIFYNGKIY
jgi:hypothetical protein